MATARTPPPTGEDPVKADPKHSRSSSKMIDSEWFGSSTAQAKNP